MFEIGIFRIFDADPEKERKSHMKRKLVSVLLCAALAFGMVAFPACSSQGGGAASITAESSVDLSNWDAVVEAAKGTEVTFYGYGADETFNKYMTGTVKDYMKEHYDIDFEWIGMPKTDDVVTMVSDEKQAGSKEGEGATDLLWLGSFQFASMKDNGLLHEDIQQYVPNVKKYIADDNVALTEFCDVTIDNMAVPWDPTQYVLISNDSTTSWTPKNAEEFLEWCKDYPGFMTYPSTDNSYGKAIVWLLLVDYMGTDWYKDLDENSSYEEVKAAMEPGLEYLRELNPYLWNEGKTYPSTPGQQLEMFSNNELGVTVDWVPYSVGAHISDGTFEDTCKAFIFDSGMVESWDGLLAVPYNCSNLPGALVTANALLTPELGYAMLAETGYPPAVDYEKLSADEKAIADAVDVGKGSLTQAEVAKAKKVEFAPVWMVDMLNEIWQNEVAGKYNE